MSAPLSYARNISGDLFVYALQSAYNSNRVYDVDFALSRDADAYEKVRRDPVIAHAFQQRLHKVAGRSWHIAPCGDRPQDKLAAGLVEEAIREQLENFTEGRYELAQAVVFARTFSYICSDRRTLPLGGLKPQAWWVPTRLEDIDRRRFRFVPVWTPEDHDKPRRLKVHMELYSIARQRWEAVEHPEWFVRHVYQDEEARLGHGRGLLEAVYFYWWMRSKVLEEGIQWVERWAQGLIIAKVDGLRPASEGKKNDTLRDQWIEVFKSMRSRNVLAAAKEDEVEIHDPPGTGADMTLQFLKYLDQGIQRLILGEVRASGGAVGESGSRAQAQVESDTSEAMIQYDRTLLDETLTRDLVGAFWRNNRPQLAMVGLGDAKRPVFETVQEKYESPNDSITMISSALTAGIPLRKDEVYRKIGMTPPAIGDEVFEGKSLMTPELEDPFGDTDEAGNPVEGKQGQDPLGHFKPKPKNVGGGDEKAPSKE